MTSVWLHLDYAQVRNLYWEFRKKKKKAYINNPFVVQLAIFIIMVKFQNNVNLIKDKHKNT